MGFDAKVLADSVSPAGHRLTTLEVTLPRIVLAEFNTHRMFSRNSASSRAIPVEKRIAAVQADPFIPEAFGKNQKGMQAGEFLEAKDAALAQEAWQSAMEVSIFYAGRLAKLEVHKQIANRLLEPFSWHTIIVTATEWSNFWGQRISPLAQPEICKAATLMKAAMDASEPKIVRGTMWHLPLVPDYEDLILELPLTQVARISAARCARISYLTHDGKRDTAADLALFDKLVSSGHMSPLEHVATPYVHYNEFCGNFHGWLQLRKTITNENDFSTMAKQ